MPANAVLAHQTWLATRMDHDLCVIWNNGAIAWLAPTSSWLALVHGIHKREEEERLNCDSVVL